MLGRQYLLLLLLLLTGSDLLGPRGGLPRNRNNCVGDGRPFLIADVTYLKSSPLGEGRCRPTCRDTKQPRGAKYLPQTADNRTSFRVFFLNDNFL